MKEIQEFNRKKIYEIILNTKYVDLRPYDLGIVLLCLKKTIKNNFVINWNQIIFCYVDGNNKADTISWDLGKQTLEEQSEECQRAIYKLLGGL